MRAPTSARWPTAAEWNIVTSVFHWWHMPLRQRVFITDALGIGDCAFVIPTAAISLATLPAVLQVGLSAVVTNHLGTAGDALTSLSSWTGFHGPGALLSQTAGIVNAGYTVNVGPVYYPNMMVCKGKLVHEMTHVWQGENSLSATTFVANSVFNRCKQMFGHPNSPYDYTPGANWRSYNVEQQADIVKDWYLNGMPQTGPLWPYIRDYVRRGRA